MTQIVRFHFRKVKRPRSALTSRFSLGHNMTESRI